MFKNKIITLLGLIFINQVHGFSQCAASSLTIRTGWDYSTGNYISTNSADPYWTVSQDQNPLTTEPRSAYIPSIPSQTGFINSGLSVNGVDNWCCSTYSNSCNLTSPSPCPHLEPLLNPGTNYDAPIIFTFTFIIGACADLNTISLEYGLVADDYAKFCLNGNFVNNNQASGSSCMFSVSGISTCNTLSNPTFFSIGVNVISISLYNTGGSGTYFRFGAKLATSQTGTTPFFNVECGTPGMIAGQKFRDANRNGIRDVGDPIISGWPIDLKDNSGAIISSTTTNANGEYFFTGLSAATYKVSEDLQAGYYQTFPSYTDYTVNIATHPISTCNDFGNQLCVWYDTPAYPCKGPITFSAGCVNTYSWDFGDGTFGVGQTVTHYFASAGTYDVSLSAPGATTFTQLVTINDCLPPQTCTNCIGSFAPDPGDYILSLWVKEDISPVPITFNDVEVQISFLGDPTVFAFGTNSSKNKVIEGWQRIEESFTIPGAATNVKLKLVNTASAVDAYFDDIRIIPKDAQMKSYVYDPVTLKLSAVLDESNYATLYEYDEEGKLIRVKKETEKGIMTVQENRENLKKQ